MSEEKKSLSQMMPLVVFVLAVAGLSYLFGVFSNVLSVPPSKFIVTTVKNSKTMIEEMMHLPWYYLETDVEKPVRIHDKAAIAPGLTLISGIGPERELLAKVIDSQGNTVHSWTVDWFALYPEAPDYVPAAGLPQNKPGTEIHGIEFTAEGGIVFNFERLALVHLDACSEVEWRLPYRTHHSVHTDEDGTYWASGQISRSEPQSSLPNYLPTFQDYTIVQVSPDGKILKEYNVAEVLQKNGLHGLLYMATLDNLGTAVRGDTLHMNDVEPFPPSMQPGVFDHGDLMVSLRNINAVFVFDPDTLKIKFISTGQMLRQHDPDFIDGNTISVFDNNNFHPAEGEYHSKIIELSALSPEVRVIYEGSADEPFFTNVMGKHQSLPNGNMLITESTKGRAFEITSDGKIVWEHFNIVDDGTLGIIHQATRLSPNVTAESLARFRAGCGG